MEASEENFVDEIERSQSSSSCEPIEFAQQQRNPRRSAAKLQGDEDEAAILEGSVWVHLPEELVDRILTCLPPICLLRLQAVCKRWHSLLNEHGFLRLLSELPPHGPCFLLSRKLGDVWQSAVYSYPMRTWHSLPLLAFLPNKAHTLIASAGGLLCFAGLQGRHDELYVCNPLRKECERVPDMHHTRQLGFVNMFMDRKAGCYRIVTAGDCSDRHSNRAPTEVYDSRSGTWAAFDSIPVGKLHSLRSAFCNGRLYCLTMSPCGLVAFDLDKGLWESIPARTPRALLDAFLVAGSERGGRLLLVGRVGLYSVHQSMRIWELDTDIGRTDWVEIGRMPHMLFKALLRSSAESFQCFGDGNFICFSAQRQQRWLMYDSLKKIWHWFGGCTLLSGSACKRSKGFFFEPRLEAILL